MKIDDGKQPSWFCFLLSLRAPRWGCLETTPRLVQRRGTEPVCLGPIPLELQPVPYSLPETQGVEGTSCFIITPRGAEAGGRQRRLWDSSSGGFCLNFSLVGRFGIGGVSVQSPPSPEHQRMEAAGTLSWCHVTSVLSLAAMPLSHRHSPPQGLPMHGSGFGFSSSSELRCAQRILLFLFHEPAATSVFPHLGGAFGPVASSPGRIHPECSNSGCKQRHPPMPAPISSQNRGGGVTPEPSLGAGPCSPGPNLAHGRAGTSLTARVGKQERCPGWVPGFAHRPAAVGPLGAKVTVTPRGCGSLGETVVGVREPLGFFRVVQVSGLGFGWEQRGWRLCTRWGGFGRVAWTS